jgi:hypothetical protein
VIVSRNIRRAVATRPERHAVVAAVVTPGEQLPPGR